MIVVGPTILLDPQYLKKNIKVVKDIIQKKSAIQDITKWGFTYAEVESLGISALTKFNNYYGTDIMTFNTKDMYHLYHDIINNPDKYKSFAEWLRPRFKKFILLEIPMRIYVGGDKQFLHRGDEKLEKSLINILKYINHYIYTGKITPKKITLIFFYLNLIFK